jgi:hypothetical protein
MGNYKARPDRRLVEPRLGPRLVGGVIREGVFGTMPANPDLSRQQVAALVDYLRVLRGEKRPQARGLSDGEGGSAVDPNRFKEPSPSSRCSTTGLSYRVRSRRADRSTEPEKLDERLCGTWPRWCSSSRTSSAS